MRYPIRALLLAGLTALAGHSTASAQAFPQPGKTIRIVVPTSAGGPTDAMARVLARELGTVMKTNVIVDNKVGAAGMIGASEVSRAPADGYTMLYTVDGLVTQTPFVMKKTYPIDPMALTPVARVTHGSFVLVVSNDLKVKTVKELVDYAKAHPGRLTYGSFGVGSGSHVFGEVFRQATGIDIVHVPYKGTGPAQQDLMAGRVDILFDSPSSASQLAKEGRLTVLGVVSEKRDPMLPEIPTLTEQGVKGLEQGSWLGLFAPPGVPQPVLARLQAALGEVTRGKVWTEFVQKMAFQPIHQEAPGAFAAVVKADYARWGKFIEAANIQVD